MTVHPDQRHKRSHPCLICGGWDEMPRGHQKRCGGYISEDGEYEHCARDELAGPLEREDGGTYAHRMHGSCRCGSQHGDDKPRAIAGEQFEALYNYEDERGGLLFQVVRKPGKKFLQRRPDGAGNWEWKRGARLVPYHLPEIINADPEQTVYIVEGEKDVETLRGRGLLATCNPMGAMKWTSVADTARVVLKQRDVIIIADADDVGRSHAQQVLDSLKDVVRSVRVVEPPSPYKDVSDLIDAGRHLTDLVSNEEVAPRSGVRTPGQRARALALLGPIVRLGTNIPTLDKSCRGGLPTNRLVVLGGAPGAGKTSVATWLGWSWAKAGVAVAMLAVDEGPEGVLMRIAQMEGMSPMAIEERHSPSLERLAETLDSAKLILVDGDDPMGTVEGVGELLAATEAETKVLVVDSLQTVRAAGTDGAESPRARVDAVVAALKRQRDLNGFLVISTCELSRGSYRNRAQAENINDLAAFKESGGIEYAAQTALVLRSVSDAPNLVDVTVPKNRAYQKLPFRLRMDFHTATFAEVEDPNIESPDSLEAARTAANRKKVNGDAERLASVVARHPGLGTRELRGAVARELGWGVARFNQAKDVLGTRLERVRIGRAETWRLASRCPGD